MTMAMSRKIMRRILKAPLIILFFLIILTSIVASIELGGLSWISPVFFILTLIIYFIGESIKDEEVETI